MFESIDKVKVELPKVKSVSKEVNSLSINIYQKAALVIFLICIFLGIIIGNLFPVCGSSYEFYTDVCATTEFNISLMLFIWFVSFIVCLFFYEVGHIIGILNAINDKLKKNK